MTLSNTCCDMVEIVPVFRYETRRNCKGIILLVDLDLNDADASRVQDVCRLASRYWYQHDFGDRREAIGWGIERGAMVAADVVSRRTMGIQEALFIEVMVGWFLLFEDHRDAIEYMLRYG